MRDRFRQFRDATAEPAEADFALGDRFLRGQLVALFRGQHPRDIVHSARTAQWLLDRGHDDADLIAAALLHDVGKRHQRRGDRVAWVVAGWLGAGKLLAADGSRLEVRRAIARSAAHAELGARMMLAAGASERAVALTRLHHVPSRGDRMLALLQEADARN